MSLSAPESRAHVEAASGPLDVLILADLWRGHANNLIDHLEAFAKHSRHRIRLFNPLGLEDSRFLDLREFDVVVIHYSIFVIIDRYLSPAFREKVRRFEGLKIQFIQDDYRRIDEMCAMMRHLGINVLYTLYPISQIPKVFDETRLPGVVKVATLAGYVPESLVGVKTPPIERRTIEVGYRGRTIPWWLGALGQEKIDVGRGVLERAPRYGLKCDIGWREEDRLYGSKWNEFIATCRSMLGTESGSSITDFDGTIETRVKSYVAEHPSAAFDEVHRQVLAPYDWKVPIAVVSPRIFESIALRSALILFPGEYSGAVTAWDHYIPLAKDFSNMDQVVAKLRDDTFVRAMIERAYQHVILSGRYAHGRFIAEFDALVSQMAQRRGARVKMRYVLARGDQWLTDLAMLEKLGVRRAVGLARRSMLALRFIRGQPALWALFASYWREGELRRGIKPTWLLADLMRLAILTRQREGNPLVRESFVFSTQYDEEKGQLTFVSRSALGDEEPPRLETIELAVRERRLKGLVWNHALLGEMVSSPFGRGVLTTSVGSLGIHRFEAFEKLLQRRPDAAWAVLRLLLAT